MKKHIFGTFCILLLFLLASCDLMGGSLAQYMQEYMDSAAIEAYEIDTSLPRSITGTPCLTDGNTVQIYLRNPKNYKIKFVYKFNEEALQEIYTNLNDPNLITFTPVDTLFNEYTMEFHPELLQAIDESQFTAEGYTSKDISGELFAFEQETLRPFGSMYIYAIANTKPEMVARSMIQLTEPYTSQSAKYIVCFQILKSSRNNDFQTITINDDTWAITYNSRSYHTIILTPYDDNRGILLANPEYTGAPSDSPDYVLPEGAAPVTYPVEENGDVFNPSSHGGENYDTFYYISDDLRSDDETFFTITITDFSGLTSTAVISSKTEKLTPIQFSADPAGNLFADNDGYYHIYVSHDGLSTEGNPITDISSMVVEYQILNSDGELIRNSDDEIVGSGEIRYPFTQPIKVPICLNDPYVHIEAKATKIGYLTSDSTSTYDFNVIHSPQFFVKQGGGSDFSLDFGTSELPFGNFKNCMTLVAEYKRWLNDSYPDMVPSDGYYINVIGDYSASDNDFTDSGYLITQNTAAQTFNGKLTIRAADSNGNPASSKNTINANASADSPRGILYWTDGSESVLSIQNLIFTGCYSDTEDELSPLQFKTVGDDSNDIGSKILTVTMTNCELTGNHSSKGGGLCVRTQGNTPGSVTLKNCKITGNTANKGGGAYWKSDGTVDFEVLFDGCEISGNTASTYGSSNGGSGGAILSDAFPSRMASNSQKLTLKDCTISSNSAEVSVGGIGHFYSGHYNSLITLKGTTSITNNTAGQSYGGIDSPITTHFDSGKITIADNTVNGAASNLILASGRTLIIDGDISGSKIGISANTDSVTQSGLTGIDLISGSSVTPPAGVFFSDNSDFEIIMTDGLPKLRKNLSTDSGGTIMQQLGDDLKVSINYSSIFDGVLFTFVLTDAEGTELSGADFEAVVSIGEETAPSIENKTWSLTGNQFTIYNYLWSKMEINIPSITILVTYEGTLYSFNLIVAG